MTQSAPARLRTLLADPADGARIVLVVAHAGGSCAAFENATDLSSCDEASEIFDVARALPEGLVDAIVTAMQTAYHLQPEVRE